ncbi:MAG: hypothetical protein ACR2JC_15240 [Chloroflexota bacterium]|nr:MAG: hypothetical protein DLM70_15695 [Chloroflexota bacterium]
MYKTWTGEAANAESLARNLEAHLNEHAAEVIAVSYAVAGSHHVLAVYRELDGALDVHEEAAVTLAEQIIEEAPPWTGDPRSSSPGPFGTATE